MAAIRGLSCSFRSTLTASAGTPASTATPAALKVPEALLRAPRLLPGLGPTMTRSGCGKTFSNPSSSAMTGVPLMRMSTCWPAQLVLSHWPFSVVVR